MWDPDEAFRRAAHEYVSAHGGRDALMDAMPWARRLADWYDAYLVGKQAEPLGTMYDFWESQVQVMRDPIARARVELLIADQIRIQMYERRCPIGDVNLDVVGTRLPHWQRCPAHYPDPPDPPTDWPTPSGQVGDELRAVLALYDSDAHEQWRVLPRTAWRVFQAHRLNGATGRRSVLPLHVAIKRMHSLPAFEGVTLAHRAWAIGRSPVPVYDPHRYADYDLVLIEDHFSHVVG